jgi:3-dehydroquinate synthase
VFKSYDFPLTVSGITIADVVKTSKSDKKMDAGKIKFILLKELGNAYIDRNVSDEELAESLEGIVI